MRCQSPIGFSFVMTSTLAIAIAIALGAGPPIPKYDVKAEVVVKGKVAAVAAIPDWMGPRGINVTLQAEDGSQVHVDAAPAEYLKMLDFAVANGDNVDVTGVWSVWNGERVLLARVMTCRKVAVFLRDPEGRPAW